MAFEREAYAEYARLLWTLERSPCAEEDGQDDALSWKAELRERDIRTATGLIRMGFEALLQSLSPEEARELSGSILEGIPGGRVYARQRWTWSADDDQVLLLELMLAATRSKLYLESLYADSPNNKVRPLSVTTFTAVLRYWSHHRIIPSYLAVEDLAIFVQGDMSPQALDREFAADRGRGDDVPMERVGRSLDALWLTLSKLEQGNLWHTLNPPQANTFSDPRR